MYHRQLLFELLTARSFSRGHFVLASGAVSDYYVDLRKTSVYSLGAYRIGEVLYEMTKYLDIDAIGGLQVGTVPLTTATVIAYDRHGFEMEGFWVRDAAKDHGTKRLIEGALPPGARVAIVEDVTTSGVSAMRAVEAVQAAGCTVATVIAIVDRLQGAAELFRAARVEYRSVFTVRDFGVSA